ncbi:MAG: hypothetical protein U5R14_00885 [Gemmatimonadota bacterium]|nr:hypothetical protein [Gemmatimonadota bacterium]
MEVTIYPNQARPGVGLRPKSESQRPLLPQHSRHCPVLEAGSALGYLVYPPLEKHEAFFVDYHGEGVYEFKYFLANAQGKWEPLFAVRWQLPIGSIGKMTDEVAFAVENPPIDEDAARRIVRAFIVPEDLGTPPGAVTFRGAYNFHTPEGWDTVYTSVLNHIDRPQAPALSVRVETDWYPQHSEFRYVLETGQGMPGAHSLPIGQVLFVPREDFTLRDATEEEIEELNAARGEFNEKKSEKKRTTRYGLEYSPHYAQESRARRGAGASHSDPEDDDEDDHEDEG